MIKTAVTHCLQVVLTPRYPLFGGWQVEFVFGYSLPLREVVYKGAGGALKAVSLFGTPLAGLIVDDITNKVGVGAIYDQDLDITAFMRTSDRFAADVFMF